MQAQLRVQLYQERVKRYYEKKVMLQTFMRNDLVLRQETPMNHTVLRPNCDKPYMINKAIGRGTYKLVSMDEKKELSRTYNVENLRFYFR